MGIIVDKTSKNLSSHAGIIIAEKSAQALRLRELVDAALPSLAAGKGPSFKKFQDLMLGLVSGADCLDDMAKLDQDEGFKGVCSDKVYSPKAYGDFLRSFSSENILDLQEALMRLAFEIHLRLFPDDRLFFFDMDSTPNYQFGEVMEGVVKNYQNKKCLDSLDIFDHKGLQYFINVRSGSASTHDGSASVIYRLMSIFKEYGAQFEGDRKKRWRACFRFDRGYYYSHVVNACVAQGADIVVGVRQDTHHFPQIVGQVHNWRATDPDDPDRIRFYDNREVEIGSTYYRPKGYARRLRYIIIRAKKPTKPLFPSHVSLSLIHI